MSFPRTRRDALRAAGSTAALAVAGCVSDSLGGDPETTRTATTDRATSEVGTTAEATVPEARTPELDDGPEDSPDRPDPLTAESARDYAKTYEYAVTYNELHDPDADTVSVSCDAVVSVEREGFYVVTECEGYANVGTLHADYGSMPVVYYVTDDRTVRIARSSVERVHRTREAAYRAADDAENLQHNLTVTTLRTYNVGPTDREVSLSVTYLGDDEPVVFEETYRLAAGSGVVVPGIAVRRGEYRIDATLDTGASATHRWTLSGRGSLHRTPVYATPDGDLVVGDWL